MLIILEILLCLIFKTVDTNKKIVHTGSSSNNDAYIRISNYSRGKNSFVYLEFLLKSYKKLLVF